MNSTNWFTSARPPLARGYINIRISNRDLQVLKKRALAEGIPYQTLVSSILHKYVDDRLVDREIAAG